MLSECSSDLHSLLPALIAVDCSNKTRIYLWLWSDLLATMQRFLYVYDLMKGNQLYALNELLAIIKCECGRPKSLNESFADGEITQKIVCNFSCVPYPNYPPRFFWRLLIFYRRGSRKNRLRRGWKNTRKNREGGEKIQHSVFQSVKRSTKK